MTAFGPEGETQIVELAEDIRIVGLSLQKSGLPVTFESLGKLWKRYADAYRVKGRGAHPSPCGTEYAVALNRIPDYITGAAAGEIAYDEAVMAETVIPRGTYVKDAFAAESFEQLTAQVLPRRDVKAWARAHGVTLEEAFCVEVYPPRRAGQDWFEMYTLTPVKAQAGRQEA